MCTQMLMRAITHGGCMDTVRKSALEVDSGEKTPLLHRRIEPASVLCLAFQCGCQCLGVLMCTQMLMRAITHGGCMDTVRKSALEVDSGEKNPLLHRRIEPACNYTWGLYGHRKKISTESGLGENSSLLHWALKPASVLCLAFQLDTVPTVVQTRLYYCTHPDLIMDIRLLRSNCTVSVSV